VIAGLEEKTALLQVSENVKLKIDRSAIATVLAKKTE
jgi:preprotein translocase subunit YajC